MTPEEVPDILLEMALDGKPPIQIEMLRWTAEVHPEFLPHMQYAPYTNCGICIWPYGENLGPVMSAWRTWTELINEKFGWCDDPSYDARMWNRQRDEKLRYPSA